MLKAIAPYGLPTIDRPFGVHLWPLFEHVFDFIRGYKPQEFRFVQGKTPMSTLTATLTTLITYYVVIFGGREVMRGREAKELNGLFKVHNLGLTIISGVLLVLFVEQLVPTVARRGVLYAVCSHGGGWTDELVVLYYVSCLQHACTRTCA
jgi:fatty acid elongase 3